MTSKVRHSKRHQIAGVGQYIYTCRTFHGDWPEKQHLHKTDGREERREKYRYNPESRAQEWSEVGTIGRMIGRIYECSICRDRDRQRQRLTSRLAPLPNDFEDPCTASGLWFERVMEVVEAER